MKKLFSVLLAGLVTLCTASAAFAAGTDRPLLDWITLYTHKVAPGGELVVGVDVFDSDGVQSGYLRFVGPGGQRVEVTLQETLGFLNATENWSGKVKLPDNLPLGEYALQLAIFYDRLDNRSRYFPETAMKWESADAYLLEWDIRFAVVTPSEADAPPKEEKRAANAAGSGDVTPPVLQWVKLGELRQQGNLLRAQVLVAAADQGDGIQHIALRFVSSATGKAVSKVLFQGDLQDGVYSGWVEVNRYQPAAVFTLENLGLYDRAGNYQAYCPGEKVTGENKKLPLPSLPAFALQSSQKLTDSTAPILETLTLSHQSADVGTTIAITATASDDIAGVDTLSLQYRSQDGKLVSVLLTQQNEQLFGYIKKYQTRIAGKYTLTRAIVTDKAGNKRSYYQEPQGRGEPLPFSSSFSLV